MSARRHIQEWLQGIPESWDAPLLKLVTRVESGHTPSRRHPEYWKPDECVIPWFSLADIWQLREGKQKFLRETSEKVSPRGIANSGARVLPVGTVVLSRTASVGFSGIMPVPMATTQDFVNFVPGPKLASDYLLWVLRGMKPEFDRLKRGSTHKTIYMPDLLQFRTPLPPMPIQRAIADFLDRKTAAIDALVEKKARLVELLAERRAALIHRAVTQGLDPDVPMEDSKVDWIGRIPAHWEIKRLKRISPSQTVGVVVNPSSYVEFSGEVPFIYGSEISEGQICVERARRISAESNRRLAKSRLRAGDLVSVRVGDPGVTAVVPPELDGMNCGSVMIVRGSDEFESEWLCYVMNSVSGRHNVWRVAYGAAQKQYNIGHAVDFVYPVPPRNEQQDIAARLNEASTGIEQMRSAVGHQIDRLKEYRQALITAAVTGQLDIPGAAA